jgi:hypothetical protein
MHRLVLDPSAFPATSQAQQEQREKQVVEVIKDAFSLHNVLLLSPSERPYTMLNLMIVRLTVLSSLISLTLASLEPNEAHVTAARRWVSFPPEGQHGGPIAFEARDDAHPDIRRRQGSVSITTSAPTATGQASSGTTLAPNAAGDYGYDGYDAPPSLAPAESNLLSYLSSLDSSLDSQVNSVIQEMTTGTCVGVPDVNGTLVTLCGPTAASAPPTSTSNTKNSAATGKGIAGGLMLGLTGAIVL